MARLGLSLLSIALIAISIMGCGGSDDGETPDGGAAPVEEPHAVSDALASRVETGSPKSEVVALLEVEPVLDQGPTEAFPGGCVFYAMVGQPLTDLWQFCFGVRGLDSKSTVISSSPPVAPQGASPQRLALLARADSICQVDYGMLSPITTGVSNSLAAFEKDSSAANRDRVATQIGEFVENIEGTEGQLSAFSPPDDGLDAFDGYIDSLRSQIDVLKDARGAFLKGEIDAYSELGMKFTELGKTAKQQAQEYGFSQCSASSFA